MPKNFAAHASGREAHKESPSDQGRADAHVGQPGRHGEKSAKRQEAHQGLSGYRQKIRARKMVAGNKAKSGCFPKLLMLFLPFMAVGSYLFLSS